MKIIKSDSIKSVPIVFEIAKNSFNRPFDRKPSSLKDVGDYISGCDVYLLKDNNNNVGYFVLKNESSEKVELKSMAVTEEHQGKGYGSALMKKLLEVTENRKVHLVTHPKYTAALVLYLKNGFHITGWIKDYFGDGQPRLKLEK